MIAHVKQDESDRWEIHKLKEHLEGVAEMAGRKAEKFFSKDWAIAASLLHDLGKGSREFQDYISSKSGYSFDAHIEDIPGRVTHSTHGANWSYHHWGAQIGKILAYLIAGHHGKGLPDWYHEVGVGGNLEHCLKHEEVGKLPELSAEFISEVTEDIAIPTSVPLLIQKGKEEQFHLWIRMLYSCLVDAVRVVQRSSILRL